MAPVARDTAEAKVQNSDTQAVEADCRQYIINSVKDTFEVEGEAPALAVLFDRIKQNPGVALTAETAQGVDKSDMVRAYVGTLETRYSALRPAGHARR